MTTPTSLIEILGYGFAQRALIAGIFIALLCALLGVFLVLRRFSLIGDGLAHVTFGSVAVALALHASPLLLSIPIAIVGSLVILRITHARRISGDAAIGILSSTGIAAGVLIVSLSGRFTVDLLGYLFGNILAIGTGEVVVSIVLSLVVIAAIAIFYHDLFAVTFDEDYARTIGVDAGHTTQVLAVLTAVAVVLAMRIAGVMLVSALMILPVSTALMASRGFFATLVISALVAIATVVSGMLLSFGFNLPTGATIVVANTAVFLLAFTVAKIRS